MPGTISWEEATQLAPKAGAISEDASPSGGSLSWDEAVALPKVAGAPKGAGYGPGMPWIGRKTPGEDAPPYFPVGHSLAIAVNSYRSRFAEQGGLDAVGQFDYGMDRLPFFGAATSAVRGFDVMQAAKRLETAAESGGEYSVEDIDEVARYLATEQHSSEKGYFGKVFDVVSALPGFGVEMAATGGVYTGVKKGVEKVAGKALASTLGRAVGVAAQTTLNPGRVASSTVKRMIPEYQQEVDADGNLLELAQVSPGDEFGTALLKGFGDAAIETGSERAGGILGGILGKPAAAIFSKLPGAARLSQLKDAFAKRWLEQGKGRTVKQLFDKVAKEASWNGVVGEVIEERAGDTARIGTGIESPHENVTGQLGLATIEAINGNHEEAARLAGQAGSQLAVEVGAFAVPGAINLAAQGAAGLVNPQQQVPGQPQAGQAPQPPGPQPGATAPPAATPADNFQQPTTATNTAPPVAPATTTPTPAITPAATTTPAKPEPKPFKFTEDEVAQQSTAWMADPATSTAAQSIARKWSDAQPISRGDIEKLGFTREGWKSNQKGRDEFAGMLAKALRPKKTEKAEAEPAKPVEEPKREFSSTQVNLPAGVAHEVLKMGNVIDEADLASDGRETEPHVTVKYGLHTDEADEVRKLLANEPPIRVKLGKSSIFPAKESSTQRGGDQYDVVKLDIDSDDLRRLNAKIADALPHTDTHPTYNPHVTLAYVKPGKGTKYVGRDDMEGQEFLIDKLTFSGKGGQKVEIPLKGTKSSEEPPPRPGTQQQGSEGPKTDTETTGGDRNPKVQDQPEKAPPATVGDIDESDLIAGIIEDVGKKIGGEPPAGTAEPSPSRGFKKKKPKSQDSAKPPGTTPVNPEKSAGDNAMAEAKASLAALRDKMKGKVFSGVDPELLRDTAIVTAKFLKAGVVKFSEYIKQVAEVFGRDATLKAAIYFESAWESVRNRYPQFKMDEAGKVSNLIGAEDDEHQQQPKRLGDRRERRDSTGVEDSGDVETGSPEVRGEPDAESIVGSGDRSGQEHSDDVRTPVQAGDEAGNGGRTRDDRVREPSGQSTKDLGPKERSEPERVENYRIDESSGVGEGGGQKTLFRQNVDAIRTLKKLETEGRIATPTEQATLAKFVGWGGMPQAFERKGKWEREYDELKSLLTDDEYAAARSSTRNAHYTSPDVIRAMWSGLEKMGFTGGHVNEPAAGVGHFFGLMPAGLAANSRLSGVEMDSLTARIAQKLYPLAKIENAPFQKVPMPNDHYDLFISNVPFAKGRVTDTNDRDLSKLAASIHDYYFAKAIKKTRPGGLVVFITSRFSMDKADSTMRRYWSEHADLLGSIRLPRTAFEKNAKTEVVTDIIVLQKRADGTDAVGEPFARSVEWKNDSEEAFQINEYYAAHPGNVLGTLSHTGTMYGGDELTVEPDKSIDVPARIADLMGEMKPATSLDGISRRTEAMSQPEAIYPSGSESDGSLVAKGGKLYQKQGDKLVEQEIPFGERGADKMLERITNLGEVRDAARKLLRLQIDASADDADVEAARKSLGEVYDRIVAKWGFLNSARNFAAFRLDYQSALIRSLEAWDSEKQTAVKADIFTKRTQFPHKQIDTADSPAAALAASLTERGRVDPSFIGRLRGIDSEAAIGELGDLVYENPSGGWEQAELYLSGNVRQKLIQANEAAAKDKRFQRNAEALKQVQPADVGPEHIKVRLGAPWIPAEDYEAFVQHLVGVPSTIRHVRSDGSWNVTRNGGRINEPEIFDWGIPEYPAVKLIDKVMNYGNIQVTTGEGEEKHVDTEKTAQARAKSEAIKREFQAWLWNDDERVQRLVRIYNDQFNNLVLPEFDGSHLKFPGMSATITLDKHQKNVAWRIISTGNTLMAHVVGAGKTFAMQAAAMEMRRLGIAKKPMFVIPNHLIQQFPAEFLQLYPGAKILAATPDDFTPAKRQTLMNRITTGDWDAVVVPATSFEKIPMNPERVKAFFDREINELESDIRAAKAMKGDNRNFIKELENAKENLQSKLEALQAEWKKDTGPFFDELGVDALFVDEAHNYKNLWFRTKMSRIPGVAPQFVQKTFDMLQKTDYLNQVSGNRGVVFATGTPVANSISELYTMQRYLQPGVLKERGIEAFDAWASQFGEVVTDVEVTPEGGGFRVHSRFRKFTNLPELQQMFRQMADVQTAKMLNLPRPKLKGGKPKTVQAEESLYLTKIVESLVKRAEAVRSRRVDPSEDNMLAITNDGRDAAIDLRLYDSGMPDQPTSKLNIMVDNAFDIWERTADKRATQIIWLDRGVPGSAEKKGGVNLYADIKQKLVDKGVPVEEVAFIHDAKDDKQRAELFKKMRAGRIRILLANSERMATGANVQKLLYAAHHLDAPWRPADVEQRDGRILRRGNENPEVEIYRYVTKGSFDAYMWQTLENKATAIEQLMDGKLDQREIDDVGGQALEYAEIKALASKDPRIMEFTKLRAEVATLSAEAAGHQQSQFQIRSKIRTEESLEKNAIEMKPKAEADWRRYQKAKAELLDGEDVDVVVDGRRYTKRKEAGAAFQTKADALKEGETAEVATVFGFPVFVNKLKATHGIDAVNGVTWTKASLRGEHAHLLDLGEDGPGNITRLVNKLENTEAEIKFWESQETSAKKHQTALKDRLGQAFDKAKELDEKQSRLTTLEAEMSRPASQPQEEGQAAANDLAAEADAEQKQAEDESGEPLGFGIGALTRRDRVRPGSIPDAIKSSDKEVEQALQNAHGVKPTGIWARISELIDHAWKAATRSFVHLSGFTGVGWAKDHFRLLKQVRANANDFANRALVGITDPLNAETLTLFERKVVIDNLVASVERGEPLRFRFASIEQIKEYQQQLDNAIASVPAVQKALKNRKKFIRSLVDDLVNRDLLPATALDNADTYYHQQVLIYATAAKKFGSNGKSPRQAKKGFQKRRVTGLDSLDEMADYNTAYIEAEKAWVTEAAESIEKHKWLERLAQEFDILDTLKQKAKAQNYETLLGGPAVVKRANWLRGQIKASRNSPDRNESDERLRRKGLIKELEAIDPLYPFRKKIAMFSSRLKKLRGAPKDEEGKAFFKFAARLAGSPEETEGKLDALGFFKWLSKREQFIQEKLGDQYATWQTLLDDMDGYEAWQPDPGNLMYFAATIPEQLVAEIESQMVAEIKVPVDKIRRMMVMGSPKPSWVLPKPIVDQLVSMEKPKETNPIVQAAIQAPMAIWKSMMTIAHPNPMRSIGHVLRNFFGDIEPVLAAAPGALPGRGELLGELLEFYSGKRQSRSADLQSAIKNGVLNSSMAAADIPTLKDMPALERFFSDGKRRLGKVIAEEVYGRIRTFNEFREATLRYATFKYFKRHLEARTLTHYGASRKSEIDDIMRRGGVDQAAAKMSRDLLGDYANLTVFGDWMRKFPYPFWSWNEVNLKRWPMIIANAYQAGQLRTSGTAAGVFIGTALTLRAGTMHGALWVWNNVVVPAIWGGDPEEELSRNDLAKAHLILGRNNDSSINVLRGLSGLGDMLEWAGMNTAISRATSLAEGQMTAGDVAKEMGKDPLNKLWQGINPAVKGGSELLMGASTFPDFTSPHAEEPIDLIAGQLGLRDEVRIFRYHALGDATAPRPNYLNRSLGVSDVRQNTLSEIYDLREQFERKQGKATDGAMGKISPYADFRAAAFADNAEAFGRAKRDYLASGGSYKKFLAWTDRLDPISSLTDAEEKKFITQFLTAGQRQKLRMARDYSQELRVRLRQWWFRPTER